MKATHKMRYTSGGGTECDGGDWHIKETPKMFIFTKVREEFFESHCPKVMRIRKENERSHCLRNWDDDTFTIYPFQSGIPHYFEALKTMENWRFQEMELAKIQEDEDKALRQEADEGRIQGNLNNKIY